MYMCVYVYVHIHIYEHTYIHTYRQAEYLPPPRSIWWTDAPTPSRGRPTRFTKFRPSLDSARLFFRRTRRRRRMASRRVASIAEGGALHDGNVLIASDFFALWWCTFEDTVHSYTHTYLKYEAHRIFFSLFPTISQQPCAKFWNQLFKPFRLCS